MFYIRRTLTILKLCLCIYIIYCLIFEFKLIKSEIRNALFIWINIIIPSVFPYLVLSDYITKSEITKIFEKAFGKIFGIIFKISPCSSRAVICSFICGYPSGAISALSLVDMGYINRDEAKRLICFTNNAGPLFLVCAVGTSMLGSARDGFAIYVIQLISAFIYAFVSSIKLKNKTSSYNNNISGNADLCESVNKGVIATINICGFMVVAYILSACTVILVKSLNMPCQVTDTINLFIKGFFEISSGVSVLAKPYVNPLNFAIICGFVSWSGFSVIMQIHSAAKYIIDFKSIFFAKTVQSLTSFSFGYIYKSLSSDNIINFDNGYIFEISIVIGIILLIKNLLTKVRDKI